MAFQKFFAGELGVHDSSACRYLILRKFTEQDDKARKGSSAGGANSAAAYMSEARISQRNWRSWSKWF